jgi:ABC-type uncharacterized transport system fused permease/ATPase subunit
VCAVASTPGTVLDFSWNLLGQLVSLLFFSTRLFSSIFTLTSFLFDLSWLGLVFFGFQGFLPYTTVVSPLNL